MGGRRIALLGSMLLLAGALAGCGDSTDSDEDTNTAASPMHAAPPAAPPGGKGDPGGRGAQVATTGSNPSSDGCKCEDPEPSPWVPGSKGAVVGDDPDDGDGSGDDNGMNPGIQQAEPEPAPWTTSHGDTIHSH